MRLWFVVSYFKIVYKIEIVRRNYSFRDFFLQVSATDIEVSNFSRSSHHTVRPVQRLWCYLVRQKRLENIFFYYCFPRRGDRSAMLTNSSQTSSTNKSGTMMPSSADASSYFSSDFIDSHGSELPENPVTVIYKDPGNEVINAICFNNIPLTVSHSIHCLVSATPKDVTESDITDIVSPAAPSAGL